jgi:primosomal protein N' (replication factor Y)
MTLSETPPLSYVNVLLPLAADRLFTYALPANCSLTRGDVVGVPFRNKLSTGIVWDVDVQPSFLGKIKEVLHVYTQLPTISLAFIEWVARYTMTPRGLVAKMVLSGFHEKGTCQQKKEPPQTITEAATVTLSPEQQEALAALVPAIRQSQFQPFLLEGVTGSGKTEVYFQAIAEALALNKQVLVMLPEIALTHHIVARFATRFGHLPQLWHSGITPKARRLLWQRVLQGEPCVVIGARSALFLPFTDLGLIIIDEEHDASFKQEEQVLYHARDMAVVRAQLSEIPILLASATPSLETVINAQAGRYGSLHLTARHGGAVLPTVQIVDMCKQPQGWLSQPLQLALTQTLAAGQQAMLFLNRRGYAPLTLCRSCGYRFICPGCTAWLVEHKHSQKLHCHHCGYAHAIPSTCPQCQAAESLVACGPGVERIHEAVQNLLPQARLALLTSDTLATPSQVSEMFARIAAGEIDIMIGTQVLAKGHHFPLITTIGVIDADLGLSGGDLRASERTFQLLHQVAGRAGRGQLAGHVFLQTYQPQHPVIQALATTEIQAFLACEAQAREAAQMPPFGRLASLIVSGLNRADVEATAKLLAHKAPRHPHIDVLGPVPAPLAQLRGRHRWRLLFKTPRTIMLQSYLGSWLPAFKPKGTTRITIDIDPYSFL